MALVDRLEAAFRAGAPRVDLSRMGPNLRAQIETALARGRAAFPDFFVGDESFARYLARAVGWISDAAMISTLLIEDLYLACACLDGAGGATNTFVALYGNVIRRTVERTAGKSDIDDIVQEVISDLFVGSPTSGPEIGNYAGRAPLARWLDVVARRAALRWLKAELKTAPAGELAAAEANLGVGTPPELALFRQRYRAAFERALKDAICSAPEADRAILRLYIVKNISVEKVGKMLGVAQSTASRWLAKARGDLLSKLKALLKERLRISSSEIESLASLLASRLDMSIAEVLAENEHRDGRA